MIERTVILQTNDGGTILEVRCGECGFTLERAEEYHPPAYCELVEAGKNPKWVPPTPRPVDYPKPKTNSEALAQVIAAGGKV